jgi:short chain dehydrogenase
MPGRLSGKVCIVTGTGGSMGRATALTFAREGALVVGCDVAVEPAEETRELVEAAGGEMVSLQPCVLSDPADCARLVDLAVGRFGRIDVLFKPRGQVALRPGRDRNRRGLGRGGPGRGRPGLLPDACGLAAPDRQQRRGREHGLAERAAQLQEPRVAVAHDEQGGDHRDDAPARHGGERARHSCQLDLAGPDPEWRASAAVA